MTDSARQILTVLAVRDLPRSLAFYRAAFGWRQTVDEPVYAELAQPGGLRLGLYAREGFARNVGGVAPTLPAPGGLAPVELYLYADDVERTLAGALAAGARPLAPLAARPWGDDAAYVADPDGHVVVIARPRGDAATEAVG